MSKHRTDLLSWIEEDKNYLVECLQRFIRAKSPNPPGDTRDAAQVLTDILDRAGLSYDDIRAKPDMPNLVSAIEGSQPGRHLVLNGHLDVFPIEAAEDWKHDPWSGDVEDGMIHGRGSSDMKTGTMAMLFAFIYLSRLTEGFKGRLTYTAVSDEESSGRYGAQHILAELGDRVRGDCVLNAEPAGVGTLRFGEKGIFQFKVRVRTRGGHSPYPNLSKSAIHIAAEMIPRFRRISSLPSALPDMVVRHLNAPGTAAIVDRTMGGGSFELMAHTPVNIGVINGGAKVNMIAADCVFEVDIRMPIGTGSDRIRPEVEKILADFPEAVAYDYSISEPTVSDPDHELVRLVQKNVAEQGLPAPVPIVSIAGSDCRHWRNQGVPAFIYGPTQRNIVAPNEHMALEDYFHVIRVHALTALDYLQN